MQFIGTGDRILTENFNVGYLYTITFKTGIYINSACIGIGDTFVMFQKAEPDLLFTLNVDTADEVDTIELYDSGGGSNNYDDLVNRPQINSHTLTGNMSGSDLGLQDTISDLDTIRAGASAGATAVQPADMTTALALKQDALNTAQLNAVNSGITSTDVAQIETNKNNILISEELNGAKNLCKLKDSISSSNPSYTVTVQTDKSIVVNKTATTSSASSVDLTESITVDTSKQYVLVGNPNTVNDITLLIAYATTPFSWIGEQFNDTPLVFTPTSNTVKMSIYFRATSSTKTVTIKPMLIEKAVYDAGFTDYQPYAMSNAELTANILPSSYNAVEVESGAPISILSGGYARIGNLVCVNLKISVTGAISQADPLVKGLPKPILEYNTGYGAVSLTNNIGRIFNVIGVGSIVYGDSTSISSGTVILSGMYIAQ